MTGNQRRPRDVIASVILVLIVLILAALAPYAWYWRIGIFIVGLAVVWILYPGVRAAVRGRSG